MDMKRTFFCALAVAVALGSGVADAQKLKGGVLDLADCSIADAGPLVRPGNEGFQGFAIHKNFMVSLQNGGYASLAKLMPDGKWTAFVNFPLGSQSKYNHANVANFGVERVEKSDAMPVLYVSQTKTDKDRNMTDACFVERILPEGKAELVQTILLGDHDRYYGWAVQWAIDKKHKRLIGFGNTINNTDPANNFRVMVFKLPKLKQGKTVVLGKEDILENYLIQDYDKTFPHVQIGQGGVVAGDCLIMPTGGGTEQYPSMLYVWNLKKRAMVNALNMQAQVPFEFEDCDFFGDKLYIQCNQGAGGRMQIVTVKP